MKNITKIALSVAMMTLLAGCGSGPDLTGIEQYTINLHPAITGLATDWQALQAAAQDEDCTAVLSYMRKSLNVTEENCPAIYDYFKNAPEVDWNKTEWSTDDGKAKIYEMDKGSITTLILDTKANVWRVEGDFWND